MDLPKAESGNPEIERMWAWHKIDRLLNESANAGSRSSAADEVVRLGEAYSIASEYTSFIVLENDAEFQRWSVTRRNAPSLARDRAAQEQTQAQLTSLRQKAAADLGPEPAAKPVEGAAPIADATPAIPAPGQHQVPPPTENRRNMDLSPTGTPATPSAGGRRRAAHSIPSPLASPSCWRSRTCIFAPQGSLNARGPQRSPAHGQPWQCL